MKHNFLENYYSYSSAKNIFWYSHKIKRKNREILHKHRALVLWFTGLSGSGKSTLASLLEEKLHKKLISTYLLDGDNIRHGLCRDLSFNRNDRRENMRRVGEVIKLLLDAGLVVIAAFVSPCNFERKMVRNMVIKNRFIEIFVDTPLEVCEKRDSKGLYKKARSGEIKNFIGVDITYEKPKNPEIYLDGKKLVKKLVNYLMFKVYKKIVFKC